MQRLTTFTGASFYLGKGRWAKMITVNAAGRIVTIDNRAEGGAQIDFGGRFVFPGFEDAHNHPLGRARIFEELDFRTNQSTWEEARTIIQERSATTSSNKWIIVHGWNTVAWGMITRFELDELSPDRGIILVDISNHGAVVNTRGVQLLRDHGIEIDGFGVVNEHEFNQVMVVTAPDTITYISHIPRLQEKLLRLGVVAVHDMHVTLFEQLDALTALEENQKLILSFALYLSPQLLNSPDRLTSYLHRQSRFVQVKGVKLFIDGAFGTRTAAVNHPYNDGGGNGTLHLTVEEARNIVRRAVNLGLTHVAMHCIGDRGIEHAVEIFKCLHTEFKDDITAWRFEHLEMPSKAIVAELSALDAVASMQPNFLWDAQNYKDRLGDRSNRINPFRMVLDAGMKLIFGSDDMPSGPLGGLSWTQKKTSAEYQRISLEDGMDAYTCAPAEIVGAGERRGRIARGFDANFIVLNYDPFKLSSDEMAILNVQETWIKGQKVFGV